MRKALVWVTVVCVAALVLEGVLARVAPRAPAEAIALLAAAVALRTAARAGGCTTRKAGQKTAGQIRLKA